MITLFNIRPKGFNIGNDAINVGLRDLVQSAFGRVVNLIEIPAVSHYESQSKAGLTAKTIHEINRLGDGVIVGGGNLFENNELSVATESLASLQPPMMLFSMSRGKIYNRFCELVDRTDVMPDRTLNAIHRRANYALARDSSTVQHLHQIDCGNAVLGACPTMFLNRIEERLPTLPDNEVPGALISIRTPGLMNLPARLQSRVQKDLSDIIESLRNRGYKRLRIMCNDVRDTEFASLFQSTHKVDFLYTADVYWYLSLLRQADVVVSYRLHATVPCLSFGTPVVNISYDERAECLIDDLGYGEWNINLVENEKRIGEAVDDRLGRLHELEKLRDTNSGVWEKFDHVQQEAMRSFARDVETYARSAHSLG